MYGQDILCGISKVPFEIPHKISYPYIEICVFYSQVKFYWINISWILNPVKLEGDFPVGPVIIFQISRKI